MWNKLSISVYGKACLWLCCILFVSLQFTERVDFDHKKCDKLLLCNKEPIKFNTHRDWRKCIYHLVMSPFCKFFTSKIFDDNLFLTSKWCKSLIAKGCQAPIGAKLEKANWLNKQISWLWRKGSSRKTYNKQHFQLTHSLLVLLFFFLSFFAVSKLCAKYVLAAQEWFRVVKYVWKNQMKGEKKTLMEKNIWFCAFWEPSIMSPHKCPAGTRTRPATWYFFRYPTRPDSVLEISG